MQPPRPKKAAENPIAAALLASVLRQQGTQERDRSTLEQAAELEKIARRNEATPQGPYAARMREMLKAIKPKR